MIGARLCHSDEPKLKHTKWVSLFTCFESLLCLALVVSSQMKWWLSSPFLITVRVHVFICSAVVWALHVLAIFPECALCRHENATTMSWFVVCVQVIFWLNKVLGFGIINTQPVAKVSVNS